MAEALAGPQPGAELLPLTMVGRLDDDLRMTASPARRAQLYVLAATKVPGVLVEMGYISSRKDEVLLRNQRHRAIIARAIRDAVTAVRVPCPPLEDDPAAPVLYARWRALGCPAGRARRHWRADRSAVLPRPPLY